MGCVLGIGREEFSFYLEPHGRPAEPLRGAFCREPSESSLPATGRTKRQESKGAFTSLPHRTARLA